MYVIYICTIINIHIPNCYAMYTNQTMLRLTLKMIHESMCQEGTRDQQDIFYPRFKCWKLRSYVRFIQNISDVLADLHFNSALETEQNLLVGHLTN